ncbi:MAG: DinB family protein [Flavobacteriales bacterium]|nr:DinB family protein [Flavobacteriales bacterium]
MLSDACSQQLEELAELLLQLSPEDYSGISPVFKSSSIGQHVRHILEFFECLISQYDQGEINYDLRRRDLRLEADPYFALEKIRELQTINHIPDKELSILQDHFPNSQPVKTSFYRELLYNLEHCVHHQALIRLACLSIPQVRISENFGVARSTLTFISKKAEN